MTEKLRKPTPDNIAAAHGKTIPDVIAPKLKVLFVGINPGLYSAAVGCHFARPGNRFWPALHQAGFTDRLLDPSEQSELVKYGCGITNLAHRATARADELSRAELIAGGKRLQRKVKRHRIWSVVFLGVTAYRAAFDRKRSEVGRQEETMGGATIWVLPNPSGLNAHYQLPDFVRLFKEVRRRAESLMESRDHWSRSRF